MHKDTTTKIVEREDVATAWDLEGGAQVAGGNSSEEAGTRKLVRVHMARTLVAVAARL